MAASKVVSATVLVAASTLPIAPAAGQSNAEMDEGSVSPRQWPDSHLAAPELEGWPNAIRMWGPDRHQTALAVSLTLRGNGGYPFDSADATSGGGRSLSSADGWWGLGLCPRSIILVASDVPADAVTAASLSDATGHSSEPYLQRVAASDPLFDPIGGFARVDTFAAPILLTDSTRDGADSLNHATRLAAQDLRTGGCNAARQAIIVGGRAAVPAEVERELISIGYGEVFRVRGDNRYGTAAAVALALGTSSIPPGTVGCEDPSAADGDAVPAFYANSVVEWRQRANRCELLGRTVVLATGLDALAAGWWTSFWQVPVLLHDGGDELRNETVVALSLLDIENLVVLGDATTVPESVAQFAAQVAGAEMRRVVGSDRYETSVEMAKIFGGWWPTGTGNHFARSSVCLVALSGESRQAKGWPDALGAGAFCGAASAPSPAVRPYETERLVGPLDAVEPGFVRTARRPVSDSGSAEPPRATRAAVPMLVVPAAATDLPPSVEVFLREAFSVGRFCADDVRGVNSGAGGANDGSAYALAVNLGLCFEPGLVIAFGGEAVITSEVLAQASALVSGRLSPASEPEVPTLVGAYVPLRADPSRVQKAPDARRGLGAFATGLAFDGTVFRRADADGGFSEGGTSAEFDELAMGEHWLCLPRGTYGNARWLVTETSPYEVPLSVADFTELGWYLDDAAGDRSQPRPASPGCLATELPESEPTYLRAVGPAGRTSQAVAVTVDVNRRFRLTHEIEAAEPIASDVPSDERPSGGGITRLSFRTTEPSADVILPPRRQPASEAFVAVIIDRGLGEGAVDMFSARWTVETSAGTVSGIAAGEARLSGGNWELRGMSALRSGTWLGELYGPQPAAPSDLVHSADVSGLANNGYGAGGFMATIEVNDPGSQDDTITWAVDAFINTAR